MDSPFAASGKPAVTAAVTEPIPRALRPRAAEAVASASAGRRALGSTDAASTNPGSPPRPPPAPSGPGCDRLAQDQLLGFLAERPEFVPRSDPGDARPVLGDPRTCFRQQGSGFLAATEPLVGHGQEEFVELEVEPFRRLVDL